MPISAGVCSLALQLRSVMRRSGSNCFIVVDMREREWGIYSRRGCFFREMGFGVGLRGSGGGG